MSFYAERRAKIMALAIPALDSMLTLATTFRIQRHILEKTEGNFREFEAEAAVNLSIKGTGVIAKRDDVCKQDFFLDNIGLGSYELAAYINSFPLEAAAASYLFTMLEVFGNDVAEVISHGHIARNKAWHEDIKGFADMRDSVQVQKAREAFARHFAASANGVPEVAARRIVKLKYERNRFAHDGSLQVSFDSFIRDTVAILCHIVFLTTDVDRISVYPWDDHNQIFAPQSKA